MNRSDTARMGLQGVVAENMIEYAMAVLKMLDSETPTRPSVSDDWAAVSNGNVRILYIQHNAVIRLVGALQKPGDPVALAEAVRDTSVLNIVAQASLATATVARMAGDGDARAHWGAVRARVVEILSEAAGCASDDAAARAVRRVYEQQAKSGRAN